MKKILLIALFIIYVHATEYSREGKFYKQMEKKNTISDFMSGHSEPYDENVKEMKNLPKKSKEPLTEDFKYLKEFENSMK